MDKKMTKVQDRTKKKTENKTDSGDFLAKKRDGTKPFAAKKKVKLDRGDSRRQKTEGAQIKYDATKIDKAVEANVKSIRQSTSYNRDEAQTRNNNSKTQSHDTHDKVDCKLLNSRVNNVSFQTDSDEKARDGLKVFDGKEARTGKRKLEKLPPLQRSAGKSERETVIKTKDDDRVKPKVKEVINIPYTPEDEPQEDAEENTPLNVECSSKVKSGTKPKAVTFKERNERSPKSAARESKRSGSRTIWLKGQNSGKRRCRKTNSPSPIKNGINESLPTEVVKWSPSSINNHTKPYYEAWVDRSLTAFSKCSEKERLKLEKEIIETLEHFKRPVSPELMYERIYDEAYTGKIKVRRG